MYVYSRGAFYVNHPVTVECTCTNTRVTVTIDSVSHLTQMSGPIFGKHSKSTIDCVKSGLACVPI